MRTELIAPCGMNCGICIGYLRDNNQCPGCCSNDERRPKHCKSCRIINCEHIKNSSSKFCFNCDKYPCPRLKQLDKRYRTRYKMSMIENLESIRKSGLEEFIRNEKKRWMCSRCSGTICVHRGFCLDCNPN